MDRRRVALTALALLSIAAAASGDPTAPQATIAPSSGALVQLPDGSLVVAGGSAICQRYSPFEKLLPVFLGLGYGYGGNTFDSAALGLWSITAQAEPNPRFGSGGEVVTPLLPRKNHDAAVATTLLRDRAGRLIVVGWRYKDAFPDSGVMWIVAARYTSSGALDASFADRGLATTRLNRDYTTVAGAALLDRQNRLVVAGYNGGRKLRTKLGSVDDWSNHLAVARFRPDGRLDTSFGTAGFATVDVAPEPQPIVANPNCQQDEKTCLYFAGQSLKGVERRFLVYAHAPAALALDGQDRLVAAATASDGTLILARFLHDGKADRTFGEGGVTRTAMGADSSVSYLVWDRDGRLLVVGAVGETLALLRYSAEGSLDAAFGSKGIRVTPFAKGLVAGGALLDRDGRLVVAASGEHTLAVGRFGPDGTPEKGFGADGIMTAEVARLAGPAGLVLSPQGEPTVAARSEHGVAVLFARRPATN